MSVFRRRLLMGGTIDYSKYAIHRNINPNLMNIVYAQGWSESPDYMTFEEAAAVTNIGTVFAVTTITSFNEFQYFTGVTAIPNNAFNKSNNKLASITLPPNITSIGSLAFRYCRQLIEFTIPPSLTSINDSSFQDTYITKFIFDNNNTAVANVNWIYNTYCNTIELGPNCTNFKVYDNCLYSSDYKILYRCATYRDSITFHPDITTFANSALDRVRLTNLTIPNGVTILPYGFASNSQLISVNFNNVIDLGNSAFSYSKFTSIDFTNTNITTLRGLTFRAAPLVYIRIPSSITDISSNFQDCTKVSTMICEATTPPTITTPGRTGIYNNASKNDLHIYVPDSSVNTYKTANIWSTLANYIYPLSEYAPS